MPEEIKQRKGMKMKTRIDLAIMFAVALTMTGAALTTAAQTGAAGNAAPSRPQGPCDIYAAAGVPCVAAHSTTRALYASYNGPLYQVLRQSDGKVLDISVIQPSAMDSGGYADASAQDAFCANTYCWISKIYDQSGKHNDLTQAPRGGFSGPALGGFNNLPIADMAPVTIMGHKAYGVFIEPGMGLRQDDAKGTAVDDQAEGQYWVINGLHFNSGCCFDYGNAEIDSRDDDNGTMETAYFGDAPWWYHGNPPGPWVMTDQENNLVGCVNSDGTNLCKTLPNIPWRFVTAMAKGEPHHWTSMGGDAQRGALQVMFDGGRVNGTYDPMRKQGAILLGNGGDNSNGPQGTFYEGALTAAGTFPSDATDQLVQANIVAAGYGVPRLSIAPMPATATPPGVQTFSPGSTQETTVAFTNTTGRAAKGVKLSISVPSNQWKAVVSGVTATSKTFADPVAPGATVSATFKITSGPAAFNGDLVGRATWTDSASGAKQSETAVEKVRNVSPVKINEFRISSGSPSNPTDSFIELYNAGSQSVDISNWSLTERPSQQAFMAPIKVPAGTKLATHGFYLFGLANSGLVLPATPTASTIYLRSIEGMKVGDEITIGDGARTETRKIASIGTAAPVPTTVWQPLPDGPVIAIPAGSKNLPVTSTAGFTVGQKIAIGGVMGKARLKGDDSTLRSVTGKLNEYEMVTVKAVGKPGTQAYLAADAPAGAASIQVTSVGDISVGDKIRLDIDSVGHGIETVTVTRVGSKANKTNLADTVNVGATSIKVRRAEGFDAGDKITIGTPANKEIVTVTAVGGGGPNGAVIEFTPALTRAHIRDEWVVSPGTGLDLAAPLMFNHSANLPFSDRGTGISFTPATIYDHYSNDPVQPAGTGITLDKPLSGSYGINAVVRDIAVTTAGYQGTPAPNQWFGGPELASKVPYFGRIITVREGSMVLRDAAGLVVDSLNYGGLVDPWAAVGYQAVSGIGKSGCFAPAPGANAGNDPLTSARATTASTGRFPDGADSDSNCADFLTQATATLSAASAAGATNIKVTSVEGFDLGQTVRIDVGDNFESAVIATVGTAGATTVRVATDTNATVIPVASVTGFTEGQTIAIDSGANSETAVIASIRPWGPPSIAVNAPLTHTHGTGAQVSGTGITFTSALTHAHAIGAQVTDDVPTPGAPNRYHRRTY
jgi:hypothetical protein